MGLVDQLAHVRPLAEQAYPDELRDVQPALLPLPPRGAHALPADSGGAGNGCGDCLMRNAPPPRNYPLTDPNQMEVTQPWFTWLNLVGKSIVPPGTAFSGTIPLAKLTGGGSDGSLQIVNGVIMTETAPT